MEKIARGEIGHINAVKETLNYMLPVYLDLISKKVRWQKEIGNAMEVHQGLGRGMGGGENEQGQSNNNNSNMNSRQNNHFQGGNNNENNNEGSSNNNGQVITCYKCK